MKNFVNIVIEKDGLNESRDIAIDAVLQTANIGLLENTLEYEMYESENNTQVLSIPVSKTLNEAQQAFFAKRLANKLFDKGYTKFDIEFSVNESTLNEAAPTQFVATHYGGIGGANNVMLHTDGNLYFKGPEGITRWNGNPSGEGIIGRWNPATIKGTIVNGQKVPYPSGTNFNNAPRAAAPAAAGNAPAAGNGTLRNGSRGEAVRKLQLDLGVQPADGVFGPSTEAAVKDFQQRMMPGETADGIVGPKTNTAIQQSAAIDTGDNPEIEKSDPNSQFAALSGFATSRRGGIANNPSQVDAIKELQAELKRRGLYTGAIDGKYGPGTRTAVETFQKENDLFVDGDAGPRTIQALMQRDGDITTTTLDEPQDQAASNQRGIAGVGDISMPRDGGGRIQGGITQEVRDRVTQLHTEKDYKALLQLVDQYQTLYDQFQGTALGEGTLYDWLVSEASAPANSAGGRGDGRAEVDRRRDDSEAAQLVADTLAALDATQPVDPDASDPRGDQTNPPPAASTLEVLEPQPRGYGMDQGKVIIKRGDTYFEVNVSRERAMIGQDGMGYVGSSLRNYEYDPSNPQAPVSKNADAKWFPVSAFDDATDQAQTGTDAAPDANAQRVVPARPPATANRRGARLRIEWDRQYGNTHNPDGTPKTENITTNNGSPTVDGIAPDDEQGDVGIVVYWKGTKYTIDRFMTNGKYMGAPEGTSRKQNVVDPDLIASIEAEIARRASNESVEPMPKGVFMVEDRAIWRSLYGKTHYTNGQARPRTFISESKSAILEITFEDDDKFFENYGVMWFNEDEMIDEAEYQGRKVKLGKPMAGDVKKFKVYVKNPNGNVVKVNFGQKGARIKKDNPERRRSFRARHNCASPGPRHKARYWSCRKW